MAKDKFNNELVRELAELLNETGLTEIEYGQDDWHIRVAKNVTVTAAAAPVGIASPVGGAAITPADDGDMSNHPGAVPSPMVGVVYLSADPDSPAFVQVGDAVSEGQTLCLIEAMKVFNPIHAPKAGKVARVLVSAGSPVEFGEPLFIIE